MKRIYITSLFRKENQDGEVGNFYVYDFEEHKLLEKKTLSSTFKSGDDYIGKSRGLRGLEFYNNNLYVFTSSGQCFILHPDNYEVRKLIDFQPQITSDKSSFLGVHQIKADGEFLWVTGTREDKLVKIYNDQVIDIQELSSIAEHTPEYKIENDHPWGQDRLHFNSIDFNKGKMYHTYYNAKMVYNYTDNKVVAHSYDFHGLHDVHFLRKDRDNFLFSSSNTKVVYEGNTTYSIGDFYEYFTCDWVSAMESQYNEFGFTRGVAHGDDCVFLGFAPVVLMVNKSCNYEKKYPIVFSFDPCESLYDVILDPRDWSIS